MKKNKTSSMTKISDSFYSSDSKTSPDNTINIYKHSKEYRLKRLYGTKKIHVNSLESNVEVDINDLIRLNIGGARYLTYMSTLRKIPNSRLSELDKTDDNYDIKNNEYFFDRSPLLFDYILNFYRTGELHVPLSECGSAFSNELEFWKLSESHVLPCCWLAFSKSRDHKKLLTQFDNNFFEHFKQEKEDAKDPTHYKSIRKRIWSIIKYPYQEKCGYVYSLMSGFFILLSLINLIFISYRPWYSNVQFKEIKNEETSIKKMQMLTGYPHPFFKISDLICIIYFTIEFLIEIIFCPNFTIFLKSIVNWISFLTLIVYYIQVIPFILNPYIVCFTPAICTEPLEQALSILQFIRLLRLIKLFKYYTGMRVMAYTLRSSFKELTLIITLLLSGVTVFGSLIFAAEGDPENNDGFPNIPMSFWFAMTTMTTVGFGDRVPQTSPGYLIGSLCAICGVLVVAFTVPIAVNNFTFFYSYTQSRIKYHKTNKL